MVKTACEHESFRLIGANHKTLSRQSPSEIISGTNCKPTIKRKVFPFSDK